jgi:hypothetical protein
MAKYNSTITWLQKQRENTAQALRDLEAGQKIEHEGIDVTDQWMSRYQRLIERYARLIELYEQRERENKLSENLKFKE